MAETQTASGLFVHSRAVVPRDNPPNENLAGPNTPAVSVGPTSSEGLGNTSVMYDSALPPPFGAQAWSGWPVGWDTPTGRGSQGWFSSRVSTAGTCVDTVGRTGSTFTPLVVRKDEILDPQPLWTTNPEPNLYANFDEWVKGVVSSLMFRGDAYTVSTGRNAEGYPVRWVAVTPDFMDVELADGQLVYTFNGSQLPAADVLHMKYQQVPGCVYGLGPLDWAARNALSAEALAQYGTTLAQRGGIPWGVLTAPGNLSETQTQKVRDQWNEAAPLRNGAPAILTGGMALQTLSFSPENMALLSLREFDEQRIAAAFGVPPFFVGLPQPSGMNYTSASMLADLFYRNTLRPMMKNIGAALSYWALPRGTNVVFDASEYLAPDLPQRVAALVAAAPLVPEAAAELRRVLGIPTAGAPVPDPMGITQ